SGPGASKDFCHAKPVCLPGQGSSRRRTIQHFELDDILEPLYALAREAGDEILRYYHSGEEVESEAKADNTPVTEADIAAHHLLMDGLARFGLPVLSEESGSEARARRDWPAFWMVDPLDGTREFLGRTGEFTINIALIEGHTASFGLIAVPVGGAVYAGGRGLGAWKRVSEAWVPIHCRALPRAETLVVVASRRHRGEKLDASLATLEQHYPDLRRDHAGSALKFCQLAEGRADFYPRYSPCSEWDTAAGQAIVEGAGGEVLGMDGEPLTYNARDSLLSPHFHAVADPSQSLWELLV
ncbi:MAG: 3'(2'),5'-bisphosphate nucleotidase CysQ, partial [Halieaceae bacterium]|nr:3'(2'),5'-bisphosphate nucleotidase CysQ [Halieaceae bacterium]